MKKLIISVLTAVILSAGAAALAADMPCGCVYCTNEFCRSAESCPSGEKVCDGTGVRRHIGGGGQRQCRGNGCGHFCLDNAF